MKAVVQAEVATTDILADKITFEHNRHPHQSLMVVL